ncbi:unnamed protein product [Didymodactylos carnosus]|uniref:Uncharacterized protein n=1 Tax=Didymodactylos carnosus TaxID=1234261 RepID=A0A813RGI4_9BILA|nr:unnamed protein product [Didymodactylos carnosus]CAF3563048.1 unnamed protein product [Didymodactylos carnosus]
MDDSRLKKEKSKAVKSNVRSRQSPVKEETAKVPKNKSRRVKLKIQDKRTYYSNLKIQRRWPELCTYSRYLDKKIIVEKSLANGSDLFLTQKWISQRRSTYIQETAYDYDYNTLDYFYRNNELFEYKQEKYNDYFKKNFSSVQNIFITWNELSDKLFQLYNGIMESHRHEYEQRLTQIRQEYLKEKENIIDLFEKRELAEINDQLLILNVIMAEDHTKQLMEFRQRQTQAREIIEREISLFKINIIKNVKILQENTFDVLKNHDKLLHNEYKQFMELHKKIFKNMQRIDQDTKAISIATKLIRKTTEALNELKLRQNYTKDKLRLLKKCLKYHYDIRSYSNKSYVNGIYKSEFRFERLKKLSFIIHDRCQLLKQKLLKATKILILSKQCRILQSSYEKIIYRLVQATDTARQQQDPINTISQVYYLASCKHELVSVFNEMVHFWNRYCEVQIEVYHLSSINKRKNTQNDELTKRIQKQLTIQRPIIDLSVC